ncbi:GNAT family N-acetyltransferase [Streptomyces sp. GC420]|uniref:GNAT family N-acetyltransferase n=1 Tax=Streptomyces sp. GC420 TaxID=2697568 RepID=UPI001414D83D|nr:GNAT family N-acetyltransferase [Streptomyces sp. GC420]NBM17697.1 GNAT family N-acetyltransferase [Streptomyces sp. GC420]
MSLDVRTISRSDLRDWARALNTGFLRPPSVSDEEVADRGSYVDPDRTQGAFDGGRCVATFRSFSQEVTAVGGAAVAANAISNVSVSPTHRRRGLLGRMMANDLAAARERGDAVATLIAAEYPIYGRYGFGPATWATVWEVDVPRAGLDPRWSGPECGGRIDLVDGADVRKLGPELYERLRRAQPGAIGRDDRGWQIGTGLLRLDRHPWTEPFHAVYRSASGEVEGLMTYRSDDDWNDAKMPVDTATVSDMIAVTPAAERALWHFVCSVDWIARVRSGYLAPDALLPLLLPDPRAARTVTYADWLWVRVLDVVQALQARTYGAEAKVVLEVRDGSGLSGGRFRLDASRDGASCRPTTENPGLVFGLTELGAIWLGDESVARLAALGRVTEERPGAAATADALFRTSRRPWCPDMF